jgi:hypothetical protein
MFSNIILSKFTVPPIWNFTTVQPITENIQSERKYNDRLVSGFVTAYPYCYDFSNGAIMTICQLIDGQ